MASLRDTLANLVEQYKASDTPLANLMRGDKEGAKQAVANALQQATQDPYSGLNVLGTTKLIGKTAQELAHEVAQKNAVEMLGLHPENTAMERARALGFNVNEPVYHGTGADIKQFNPLLADTRRKTGTPTGSIVVSSNPDTASTYANMTSGEWIKNWDEGGNVIPMYLRKNKSLVVNAAEPNYTPNWNNLLIKKYPEIETTNELAALAKNMGKESATIKNIKDNAVMSSAEGNTTFVFKPELLRSKFAAFDPARANEPDLLAGAMTLPIATDKDKRNKIIDLLKNK